eukprot:gnl/TRDRNA2_/TRDRNA2_181889_c0_seq1.p1 gnl/TRDRNA2_/TRDRNA2_181889_c0~~gnl/TRDRNA2_/TRDRNA2_181889_c0_seq1.p1  ORF type:complete len:224 (+),score=40.76 gnl/TRDRNA2_/TRDRNA2_181889_c0_seq1:85-756(+)
MGFVFFSFAVFVSQACASKSVKKNKEVIKTYFDGVFLSSDFKLDKWLEDNVADDAVFQFCPLTADKVPSNRYPHCTDAKGKKAYLAYVEKDQKEFTNTRIANITYAVSEDGSQVFSRYMVAGSLNGKPVPWFDQVMAWNFDKHGKITKTDFWTDTLYWHVLYEMSSTTSQSATQMTAGISAAAAGSGLLPIAIACLSFLSGMWFNRRIEARRRNEPTFYMQIS